MPLELGMAMALRFIEPDASLQHDWLVLVPDGRSYQRFVSDFAGIDPAKYEGSAAS